MIDNLRAMYKQADEIDRREGLLAYQRYNELMRALADRYGCPLPAVVAAFVSLSPNNDCVNNLRSTISVLDAVEKGLPLEKAVVSTYRHCARRAYAYVRGDADFIASTKGPKILNFYYNILEPDNPAWVTVDGHVVGAWRNNAGTMKELIIRRREYVEIKNAIKQLAFAEFVLPNQYQATLWFARKRVLNVKYDPQGDLFFGAGDWWRTAQDLERLPKYA